MKSTLLLFSVLCLMAFSSCNSGGSTEATDSAATTDAAAAPEASPAAPDASALLQGKWQSADDPKSTMEITGDQLIQTYDGKQLEARKFAFSADCSGNECAGGAGNQGCYTSASDMDIECYSLVSISDTAMETSLVGATGKTLKYTRIK
jgi:hypothetical protein